jgi:hypothetical protein
LTSFRLRQNGGCFDYLEIKVLEVVSKCQIAFESPACQRDFASDPLLKVLNKRSPMKKRSPPHILADEHFNPPAAEQRSYSAGGGLDGVLKPLLIKRWMTYELP